MSRHVHSAQPDESESSRSQLHRQCPRILPAAHGHPVIPRSTRLPQRHSGSCVDGSCGVVVQFVRLQVICDGPGHGPPTTARGLSLRPCLRGLCPPHSLLSIIFHLTINSPIHCIVLKLLMISLSVCISTIVVNINFYVGALLDNLSI
ncbi:hypothetical protein NP493_629g00000 [Ridgeia piscesae]|uniref:Uncharacterized protein n=1 Tax=Ridgeia piscesae TaxID=27915 RepID=A0AAD9KT30_RIDPI|nr:hypothetical protein NP493_629g00000 [Ridgeia piscesae]